MNHNSGIVINGDGNVVGHNNNVLVDKRVINRITHQSPSGSGGGGGGNKGGDDDAAAGIGLVFIVLTAVAIACWKFAVHADQIYFALLLMAGASVLVQFLSALHGFATRVGGTWTVERLFGCGAALLVLAAVYWSRNAYPHALTDAAHGVKGGLEFLCRLRPEWKQVATYHAASIAVLVAPAMALVLTNSLAALSGTLFFLTGWRWSAQMAIKAGSRGGLALAIAIGGLAAWLQTADGGEFWNTTVWTERHDPFGAGSPLCKGN